MQRSRMIAVVLGVGLAGCAANIGDEDTREAEQAFSISQRTRVGPTSIHVHQGGNIEVTVTGLHLSPPGCSKALAELILMRLPATAAGKPADLPSRKIAPNVKRSAETWNALTVGDYAAAINPPGDVPGCFWQGDAFVVAQ